MRAKISIASLVVLWVLMAASSCGTEVSGDEVSYTVSAEGAVGEGSPDRFTNSHGWEIEFTRAQVLVGPIYFYSGEPRASLFQKLLGINEAYACAAHAQFQSGRTLGETPLQYGVDLLGGRTMLLEDGRGETGEVRSVELHVQNPGQVEPGNDYAASSTDTYEFEGVARRDEIEIPFSASITLPEEGTHQVVDSIATQMELSEGANLHMKLRLDRLFRDVNFEGLVSNEDAEASITPGTQAYASLIFALRSRHAFVWENSP